MVAARTCGDYVFPGMRSVKAAGNDVIDGQGSRGAAAILAGEIIPTEYFFAGHFYGDGDGEP